MSLNYSEFDRLIVQFNHACKNKDPTEIEAAAAAIGRHRGYNYGDDFITRFENGVERTLETILSPFVPRKRL